MLVEIPLSNGLVDAWINPQELNCVGFLWDPHRDTSICVKIHCISTEFTAKKHGGEKGVPFRLQVETYRHNNRGPETVLHCASCQIKVFKVSTVQGPLHLISSGIICYYYYHFYYYHHH